MTCYSPLTAYKNPHGGRPLFKRPTTHAPIEIQLACGQCLGCRIQREITWSIRLMHEADLHDDSYFVTLTYDALHLPPDNSLDHSHYQRFMRRLRKHTGQKIRFFMCGEYGENFSRPHYHALLFGLKLHDLEPFGKSGRHPLYKSELLENIWGHGAVFIGKGVTRASAVYTAGYMLKDSNKEWQREWEWPHAITGEVIQRKKPYCRMSNRPGIGADWYKQFAADVFPHDYCVMDGKKFPTPAYYRRLLEREHPELFAELKEKRERVVRSAEFRKESTPERLHAREQCAAAIAGNQAERSTRKTLRIGSGEYASGRKPTVTQADLQATARRAKA